MSIKQQEKKYYCPEHNQELILITAKQGKSAGKKFWGCPTWSKTGCTYTIPFESKKKSDPTINEKILSKIKNKNGKISVLRIIGFFLSIPFYILGQLLHSNSSIRSGRFR